MIYTQGPDEKIRISFGGKDEIELKLIIDALINTRKKESIKIAKDISYGLKLIKEKEDDLPF